MLVQADAKRRITLPPILSIKARDILELKVLEDGRIMLIPVEPIPRHQLWAWTAETKEAITASLKDPRPSIQVKSAKEAQTVSKGWTGEY